MDPVPCDEMLPPLPKTQSQDAITSECEHKWHRLKLLQTELAEVCVSMVGALKGNEPSQDDKLALLKEHKKRLEAELTSLKEKELQTLPEDEDMQQLIFQKDQEAHIQQLNETLAFMRAKRSELKESITTEKEMGNQLKELNVALKEKVSTVIQSEDCHSSMESILADMRAEIDRITALDKTYKKTLIHLLDNYFPLPSEQDCARQSHGAINVSRSFDAKDLCPLHAIIGKLVEQTLNSPHDPYIDIDETIWPQHIEFLLRSQIVRKDPKNPMKMKLTPFHL